MRHAFALEAVESRFLLSATAAKTVGASSGLHPQANVPEFTDLHGTVTASDGTTSNSAMNVDQDSSIAVAVDTMGTGTIDGTHLVRNSIQISEAGKGVLSSHDVLSKVITSGGGDVIIISFKNLLDANATYTVDLNYHNVDPANVIRTSNSSGSTNFPEKAFTFTTGSYYAKSTLKSYFNATTQANAGNHSFTAVTMGPDGKLYAADTKGYIYAYTLNSDGSLAANPTVINTIREHFGTPGNPVNRLITGIAFKPNSTTSSMELWVSDGQYAFGNVPGGSDPVQQSANNFTGEIDALSGPNLSVDEPLVVHIPRSVKDHTNNQIVFSPNSKSAFFGIAAMNAMGAADSTWGNRQENIYSATIMSLKVGGENGIYTYIHNHQGPVDLMIDGSDQNAATGLTPGTLHYNVFKGSNPLRIYADGIRNDFDMVYAADGHLYAGINGSSAGGNVPATPSDLSTVPVANRPDKDYQPTKGDYIYHQGGTSTGAYKPYTGPASPALSDVATVEEDTLLDVKNGAYYGHPDPARGEYILDDGNPSNGAQYSIGGGTGYAVGQAADRSYTKPIYDFGQDYSPDGMFQYQSVGGKNKDLDGYILVCRYSSGGDVLALDVENGVVKKTQARIQGLMNLGTPLDITEDKNTGNVYVAILDDETGNSTGSNLNGAIVLETPQSVTAASKAAKRSAGTAA